MTKPADKSLSLLDTMATLFSTMTQTAPVGTMWTRHTLEMQTAIAAEMTEATHRWLDRRHEALASLSGTTQQVMETGLTDTGAAFGSLQKWYEGMLARSAADLKAPFELMIACSAHAVPDLKQAGAAANPIRRAA